MDESPGKDPVVAQCVRYWPSKLLEHSKETPRSLAPPKKRMCVGAGVRDRTDDFDIVVDSDDPDDTRE